MGFEKYVYGLIVFCAIVGIMTIAYSGLYTDQATQTTYNVSVSDNFTAKYQQVNAISEIAQKSYNNVSNNKPTIFSGVVSFYTAGSSGVKIMLQTIGIGKSLTTQLGEELNIPPFIVGIGITLLVVSVVFMLIKLWFNRDKV